MRYARIGQLAFIIFISVSAHAQTYTWTGNGIDSNWATSANWDFGTPVNGADLVFPATSTKTGSNNNLLAGVTLNSITLMGSGFNLGGNAIAVNSVTTLNATGNNAITLNLLGDVVIVNASVAGTILSLQSMSVTTSVIFTGAGINQVNGFINGGVYGTTSLIQNGSGMLVLQSPSSVSPTGVYTGNNWLGTAEIRAGTLRLGHSDQFPRLSPIIINAGATVDLATFSDAAGSLAGAGTLFRNGVANSPNLFTVGSDNLDTVLSGSLNDSGNFQKIGDGVLTLNGTNTFNGQIYAEGGNTCIGSPMQNASFTPKGKGTLSGTSTIGAISNVGGRIAPGAPKATGILTAASVNFGGGGTFAVRINGSTAGSGYDQLKSSGAIDITNATLSVTVVASNVGEKYTILQNTGSSPVTGTFSGLSEGTRFAAGGNEFSITYAGGAGRDVVITNVSGAVTGTIKDTNGNPLAGVTVSNGFTSTQTGGDGTYALNIADGQITITPSLLGYSFSPPSRVVNGAGSSISGQDFTGTQLLAKVSGTIRDGSGSGLQGVVVTDGTRMATSGSDGTYTIASVPYGNYTISPSKASFFFTPPTLSITVAGDMSGQDFVASRSAVSNDLPLTTKKLALKFNFAKTGNDTFQLSGSLPVPAGFTPSGQTVQVMINDVTKNFTLDSKGGAKSGADSFKLSLKMKKGAVVSAQTAAFAVKGGKGDYLSGMSGTGISNTTAKGMQVTVPVVVIFNNAAYGANVSQSFTATAGKTGSTK
jgi:autotransporter-associated beta strand protein